VHLLVAGNAELADQDDVEWDVEGAGRSRTRPARLRAEGRAR
jgi:hypothetical protein